MTTQERSILEEIHLDGGIQHDDLFGEVEREWLRALLAQGMVKLCWVITDKGRVEMNKGGG